MRQTRTGSIMDNAGVEGPQVVLVSGVGIICGSIVGMFLLFLSYNGHNSYSLLEPVTVLKEPLYQLSWTQSPPAPSMSSHR